MPVFVWVSMVLAIIPSPALAQSETGSPPVMTVQGAGEVFVAPDVATVRVGIVEQASTAREAQLSVNEVAGRILEALDQLGIDEDQVQTARLMLSPVYSPARPEPGEPPRIAAYRASNTVSVRVEDLDRIGRVIDAALDSGANQLEGVFFGLRDDREAREDALRSAVDAARRKAEAMADALDTELDGLVAVSEGAVFAQPQFEGVRAAVAMQEGAPTPVSPGEIRVSATVTVEYRIIAEGR